MTRKPIKTALAALALVVATTPAAFAERTVHTDVDFRFDPSDSPAEIYNDLGRTAHRQCVKFYRTSPVVQSAPRQIRQCRAELVALAVAKAGIPELTAYHAEKTRTRLAEATR
ncbi:MAG: hypothetical protein R3C58_04545 [Parvularculaceae bacterium]